MKSTVSYRTVPLLRIYVRYGILQIKESYLLELLGVESSMGTLGPLRVCRRRRPRPPYRQPSRRIRARYT